MSLISEIEPPELKRRLEAGEQLTVLDVREPWELAIAHLPGTLNIPLGEVPARMGEIDRQRPLVIMCKAGGRSLRAAQFLASQGFSGVANLSGGITAWALQVDPSVPTY